MSRMEYILSETHWYFDAIRLKFSYLAYVKIGLGFLAVDAVVVCYKFLKCVAFPNGIMCDVAIASGH